MSPVTSASFCLVVFFLVCSSEALENITAELGQDVTLPCKADNNKPIIIVEWSRPGLDTDHVLLYRDERFDPFNQHPSYKNRADLKDREMKDGDVSLVLKNVKMEDEGTYDCRVDQGETNRRKRSNLDSDPIRIFNLEVLPPGDKDGGDKDGGDKDGGDKDGNTGAGWNEVGISLGVVGFLLTALVGFLINKRLYKKKSDLPVPPDEAAAEQML